MTDKRDKEMKQWVEKNGRDRDRNRQIGKDRENDGSWGETEMGRLRDKRHRNVEILMGRICGP